MKLGLSSYMYRWAVGTPTFRPPRPLSLAAMIENAAALGCSLLQIADSTELVGMSPAELRALRGLADGRGVRLQLGTTGATAERLDAYLAMAIELRSDIVRLVLYSPDIDPTPSLFRDVLIAAAPAYADAGVTIAVENYFLQTSKDLAALMDQVNSPAVGVCLDTANSIIAQEWPMETVSILAPYARNVHVKDYRLIPHPDGIGGHVVGAPFGEGRLDIEALLGVLGRIDRDDLAVILEQWCPRGADEDSTIRMETSWRQQGFRVAAQRFGCN
jgi:sugar phosphate isomerase/epimerase